jgi:hypothetical protein
MMIIMTIIGIIIDFLYMSAWQEQVAYDSRVLKVDKME